MKIYWGDTMREDFDLQGYLIEGVEGIVSEAIKATLKKNGKGILISCRLLISLHG
ncbi:MAG: hypothetical protein IJL32_14740 [Oscillospiraceae bacterium]|nr:hypothetical protein [Oscillospiraceae bacterium]